MDWLELTQEVDEETAEPVSELFGRYSRGSVVVEQQFEDEDGVPLPNPRTIVRAYVPPADDQLERLLLIEQGLWHLSQIHPLPRLEIVSLENKNWAEAWREHFHVLRIGHRFVIRPSWRSHEPQETDLVITLDPGMAFGTGLHPSTRLCVLALEDAMQPGMTVLDLGTGSGILAIAAAHLGAAHVLAVDNDPVAAQAADENVLANGFRGIVDVRLGSLADVQGAFDIVVVNILAPVILDMLSSGLSSRVRPGGQVIAAGILDAQADDVLRALEARGLRPVDRLLEKDWVMLRAEKPKQD